MFCFFLPSQINGLGYFAIGPIHKRIEQPTLWLKQHRAIDAQHNGFFERQPAAVIQKLLAKFKRARGRFYGRHVTNAFYKFGPTLAPAGCSE